LWDTVFPFVFWEHLNHWDSVFAVWLLKVSNFLSWSAIHLPHVVKSLSQYVHELSQLHFECDNKLLPNLCHWFLQTTAHSCHTHYPTCTWHSVVRPIARHRTRCGQWHWDLDAMVVNGELCVHEHSVHNQEHISCTSVYAVLQEHTVPSSTSHQWVAFCFSTTGSPYLPFLLKMLDTSHLAHCDKQHYPLWQQVVG